MICPNTTDSNFYFGGDAMRQAYFFKTLKYIPQLHCSINDKILHSTLKINYKQKIHIKGFDSQSSGPTQNTWYDFPIVFFQNTVIMCVSLYYQEGTFYHHSFIHSFCKCVENVTQICTEPMVKNKSVMVMALALTHLQPNWPIRKPGQRWVNHKCLLYE